MFLLQIFLLSHGKTLLSLLSYGKDTIKLNGIIILQGQGQCS